MRGFFFTVFVLALGCGDDGTPGTDGGGVRIDGGRIDGGGGGTDGGGGGTDGGGGQPDGGMRADAGPIDMCTAPSDCAWGEIDHEILATQDCICLFGCPSIIMNVTTRDRRQAQYDDLCTPGVDGMGEPCPVDDCITPPPLDCVDNRCVRPDGGT